MVDDGDRLPESGSDSGSDVSHPQSVFPFGENVCDRIANLANPTALELWSQSPGRWLVRGALVREALMNTLETAW